MEKQIIRRCGKCGRLGNVVKKVRKKVFHECPYAAAFKGYAQENDLACIWFKRKAQQ
jgi:hypothetical protein